MHTKTKYMDAKEYYQKETGYCDEAMEGVLAKTFPLMESFAKTQAIAFAEWIRKQSWERGKIGWMVWEKNDSGFNFLVDMTTEQLYQKFMEEQSK